MIKRTKILAPNLPESVLNATIISWHKKLGDHIKKNELLLEIETDKITLEVLSPESGIIESLLKKDGENIKSNQILGYITCSQLEKNLCFDNLKNKNTDDILLKKYNKINNVFSPSKRRLMIAKKISKIQNDNLFTENILNEKFNHTQSKFENTKNNISRSESRTVMSGIRRMISKRLVDVQNNTAMLTTFNEVNMKKIINIKNKYTISFKEKYGIKIGFMSFYVKAVVESLKMFPEINSFIDGDYIVRRNYFDINIAVSTDKGLVTPILRNVDHLSIAEVEIEIKKIVDKARKNKLKLDDLKGGSFTISNGGIFGSLMSTPIINPPQSAILGIHAIKDRPMAINNEVIILPMVYLALSYDHRLIDGKESIGFLVNIKKILEDPITLLLQI